MPDLPRDAGDPPLIQMRDVVAGYGGVDAQGNPQVRILDGVSFAIERGKVLGVIGDRAAAKALWRAWWRACMPRHRGGSISTAIRLRARSGIATRSSCAGFSWCSRMPIRRSTPRYRWGRRSAAR
jgi:hypothetical protein